MQERESLVRRLGAAALARDAREEGSGEGSGAAAGEGGGGGGGEAEEREEDVKWLASRTAGVKSHYYYYTAIKARLRRY